MTALRELAERRDAIAKAIADVIGHGMREKCERHADAVLAILDADDGGLSSCAGCGEPAGEPHTFDCPILDAEGDAGAVGGVPDGWEIRWQTEGDDSLLLIAHKEHGGVGAFKDVTAARTVPEEMLYLLARDLLATHPQPVRSGVVSDEQVEIVAQHLSVLGWATGGDYADEFKPDVRAALENFAKSLPAVDGGDKRDATPEMCDAARYAIVAIERQGRTFRSVREHCRMSGMDVNNWPEWTKGRDLEHFNKSACAAIIWWLMQQAASNQGQSSD